MFDDWAAREPERICLQHFSSDGDHLRELWRACGAPASLANGLVALGLAKGDAALLLPQSFETVIAHMAIYKMGAIAPLALLFGVEALNIG